jgi:hypothetical protein
MVNAFGPLVIYHQPFPFQHNVEAWTTKSFPLASYLTQTPTQNVIIIFSRLIPVHRSGDIDQAAGFSLAQPKTFSGMGDC